MSAQVLVIIGAGGMGEAIARRIGAGRRVMLSDFDEGLLERVSTQMRGDGFDVVTRRVDVSSAPSVAELADAADALGDVTTVIHTAGLSPVQATSQAILRVDLLGVAISLDEFGRVIAPGGSGVYIASMAAAFAAGRLTPEIDAQLAGTPTDELMSLPFLAGDDLADPGAAYSIAKRANQLRVRQASLRWGDRGARVNSISPGVIATPMGQAELHSESGANMRRMIDGSGTGRIGTPADIAGAAAFLTGPDATFITGTDLLVDGGAVAGVLSGSAAAPRR